MGARTRRRVRPTKSYAPVRPSVPYQPVKLITVDGRHDVYENGLWLASFREHRDAEEFRRKRLRLPWRISST